MSIPPQPTLPHFIPNGSTLTVPLMYSFLILSFLVTPITNLNVFISATSISSCFFVTCASSTLSMLKKILVLPKFCPCQAKFLRPGGQLPHLFRVVYFHTALKSDLYTSTNDILQVFVLFLSF